MSDVAPEPQQNGPVPEAPPEAPPEEPWTGPSREEWEAQQQFVQNAAPILGQIADAMQYTQQAMPPEPQRPAEPPPLDPFDPESVRNFIDYEVRSRTGDYDALMQLTMAEQGERLARQELERLQGEVGPFDNDTALMMAAGMLHEQADPTQAMRMAAQYVQSYEDRIRADERAKYGVQLQENHQAPRETSANTAALGEAPQVPSGPNRYEEVVARYMAGKQPQFPTG